MRHFRKILLLHSVDEDFAETDRDRYPMLDVLMKNVVNNYAELPPVGWNLIDVFVLWSS